MEEPPTQTCAPGMPADPATAGSTEYYAFPGSYQQQQLWFLHTLNPDSPAYHIPFGFTLKGKLDIPALERSINEIVRRHETFRTTFEFSDGALTQVVASELRLSLSLFDLSSSPEGPRESERVIQEFTVKPFNLRVGPLLRAAVIVLGAEESIFLLNFHHIILDHLSILHFGRELTSCYGAYSTGSPLQLPPVQIQYADAVIWRRGEKQLVAVREKLEYWKGLLGNGVEPLELPTDRPRPPSQTFRGAEFKVKIDRELSDRARSFCKKERKSLFVFLLAAYKVLLHKYTGKNDVVVGCPFANRNEAGLEDVSGCCMNTLPLRTLFSPDESFLGVLEKVRAATVAAQQHQEVSFEQIVEAVRPARDPSINPLFQTSYMFQDAPMDLVLNGLECASLGLHSGTAKFDCTLWMWDAPGGFEGLWEYNTDLFDAATIERMAANLAALIHEIVVDPARPISDLSALSAADWAVVARMNDTAREYPAGRCVHELFEDTVRRSPDAVAVLVGGDAVSYAQLNARANQLARHLREIGVGEEALVGICLERSADILVALLGVVKAGGAYLPLDPEFPRERLAYMVDDSGAKFLLTHKKTAGAFAFSGHEVCLDRDRKRISAFDPSDLPRAASPRSLAYVIYTSGSTGRPKGVQIEHRALVNFLVSMREEPGMNERDVLLSVTTLSFDIAALELFLPLIAGARVVIAGKDQVSDGKALLGLIVRHGITVLQATPATWRLLIAAGWERRLGIKVLCGGEALTRDLASQLTEREGCLWNMYGPTETTVWSAVKKIDAIQGAVLIGGPIANTTFHVLDGNTKPVPIGVSGELYIGGDGLARGYLSRPDMTAERFVEVRERGGGTRRVYKTGDAVRLRSDKGVEYLGRLDSQVKVRGFRIELGEIESVLATHPMVRQAAVSVFQPNPADTRIVAYVVSEGGANPTVADLREHLKRFLPDYMVPSQFQFVDGLPLTPNRKIDRKALPAPDAVRPEEGGAAEVPQDEIELRMTRIWEKTLGVKPIGVSDNFFDLGGHSLLAAELAAAIERAFGVPVPLALLFEEQTVKALSAIVRQKGWTPPWHRLVPLKAGGTKPPLYLVHGAEGNVMLYRELAHLLPRDQPVYALQSKGIDGKEEPHKTFEAMAEEYVAEIANLQPEGPYFLGGYCLGGSIAFEMACQLVAKGETVAMVAMLEAYNYRAIPRNLPQVVKLFHSIQNAYFHLENLVSSGVQAGFHFFGEKLKTEISRARVRRRMASSNVSRRLNRETGHVYHHFTITKLNDSAMEAYIPGELSAPIILFNPRRSFIGLGDLYYGWREVAKGAVKLHTLPVCPRGMLVEPFVRQLATELAEELAAHHVA